MLKTKLRGNDVYFDGEWKYVDINDSTADTWMNRDCGYCKMPNRSDEHDACLGELPNVMNACCGHGSVNEAYIMFNDESIKRGEEALSEFEKLKEDQT